MRLSVFTLTEASALYSAVALIIIRIMEIFCCSSICEIESSSYCRRFDRLSYRAAYEWCFW